MKRILILVTVLSAFSSYAQFEKGNTRVGGSTSQASLRFKNENVGFKTTKTDASVGYFVADNLVLGMMASVYSETVNFQGFQSAEFQLSPELRYYFSNKIIAGAFYPFSFDQGLSWKTIHLQVGYAAFVSEKWAFEPMIYYTSADPFGQRTNTVGLQLGISVF
jgi:hypothetical protein